MEAARRRAVRLRALGAAESLRAIDAETAAARSRNVLRIGIGEPLGSDRSETVWDDDLLWSWPKLISAKAQ